MANKQSDGYYRVTWTYRGKRYSVRAKDQATVYRKAAEQQRLQAEGYTALNSNTPVSMWIADYLETYRKPKITTRSYNQLVSIAQKYINPNIGDKRLKDVRTIDLQRILNGCAGMSQSHVDKLRILIRGVFRQARIDRLIVYDPAEAITMPQTRSGTHRAITAQEREHILALCQTHPAGLWVLFMLYTGARPDETSKARWEDIDWDRHMITLHSSKTDYGDRVVPCPDQLYVALQQQRGEDYIFRYRTRDQRARAWRSYKRALDIHMGAQTYRRRIMPETSVVAPDLTAYCLRHTYATDLQTAGVSINVAKDLLGHKDIGMTSRIYTHLSDQALDDAAQKINQLCR